MVSPSESSVILVKFPFSDLSSSKLRPAIVLGSAGRNDWILCQITSKSYADAGAIEITNNDFKIGSLQRLSYARPTKLFTANSSLMEYEVGKLNDNAFNNILNAVIDIFKSAVRD